MTEALVTWLGGALFLAITIIAIVMLTDDPRRCPECKQSHDRPHKLDCSYREIS